MNVISLFDGMGGAKIALDQLGVRCTYYSSEIDKYAHYVALNNHPDIISLGDARGIDPKSLPKIDLMIAGFPCQDLSQNNSRGQGLEGKQSSLFYVALDLLRKINPTYFLFENVVMSKTDEAIISSALGTTPVKQNSSEFSAQLRSRLYWTNFGFSKFTTHESPCLGDIIDKKRPHDGQCKMREFKGKKKTRWIAISPDKSLQRQRVYCPSGKAPCVNTSFPSKVHLGGGKYRKLTIEECEKLQTIPVGYTEGVSNTQRLKMLGNGFTVAVIAHILSHIPKIDSYKKDSDHLTQLSFIEYCNNARQV